MGGAAAACKRRGSGGEGGGRQRLTRGHCGGCGGMLGGVMTGLGAVCMCKCSGVSRGAKHV